MTLYTFVAVQDIVEYCRVNYTIRKGMSFFFISNFSRPFREIQAWVRLHSTRSPQEQRPYLHVWPDASRGTTLPQALCVHGASSTHFILTLNRSLSHASHAGCVRVPNPKIVFAWVLGIFKVRA